MFCRIRPVVPEIDHYYAGSPDGNPLNGIVQLPVPSDMQQSLQQIQDDENANYLRIVSEAQLEVVPSSTSSSGKDDGAALAENGGGAGG